MQADGAINLLIAHDNLDQANQLINLLRNASYAIHSTVIDATTELNQLLDQQHWDLALIELESQTIQARSVISALKKHALNIAVVGITSGSEGKPFVEGLRMGADYVVPMDEDQYFLLAVSASLANLSERRKQDSWKQMFLEGASRCDKLMANCKDAIALVQEGTIVFVNDAYSQLFGYNDTDEMLLLPFIDIIDQASHTKIKPYLKPLDEEDSIDDISLDIIGTTADVRNIKTTFNISQVLHQGLPALQFKVAYQLLAPKVALAADTAKEPTVNSTSQNLPYLQPKKILASIDQAILKAARTEDKSLVLYIRSDQIYEYGLSSGSVAKEQLLDGLFEYVTNTVPAARTISKFSEDALVALVDLKTVVEGRRLAEKLCQRIASESFSVGDESIALSLTICVSSLNHSKQTARECIQQCQLAIATGDGDLNKSSSEITIYCFDNEAPDRFESEQSVLEFGRLLIEKRLIGIEYQPIAALQGEVSEYYEVLMRPKVEEYPYAVPDDFIEKVFRTKVAGEIDRWVILEAVKGLAQKLKERPETKLFINLSAASIQDAGFTGWLKIALRAANIPPKQIIFELREIDVSRFIDQSEKLVRQLTQLQTQTALTHFGLSINPLLIPDRLAVDFIKIDKILAQKAEKGGEAAQPLEAILSSLQALTVEVIVPYIENPSILPMLWQHGVAYIQGYYVQEAMLTMAYDFVEGS